MLLDAYHELEQAEFRSPGLLSSPLAARFLTTSRELGEGVNPTLYPSLASVERETHFNAMNPFWQAPLAYGAAVALLVLSLACATVVGKSSSLPALLGSSIYRAGLAALLIGIETGLVYLASSPLRLRRCCACCLPGKVLLPRCESTGWAPVSQHVRNGHLGRPGRAAVPVVHLRDDLSQDLFRSGRIGGRAVLWSTITEAMNVPLPRPEHREPPAGARREQPLADDPRADRGLELRSVRPATHGDATSLIARRSTIWRPPTAARRGSANWRCPWSPVCRSWPWAGRASRRPTECWDPNGRSARLEALRARSRCWAATPCSTAWRPWRSWAESLP